MAKALKVQVMVFENHDEIKLIMKALHLIKDSNKYTQREKRKIKELLDEVYKINGIFEAQNNNA
tara:strand:+ start:241 stop:432 length:192 start_codon:yes stop_codon:yes gene_type:complete